MAERLTRFSVAPLSTLTRQLAKDADAKDSVAKPQVEYANTGTLTLPILSAGETIRVMRRCVEERQELTIKQGEDDHLAACWAAE